MNHNSNQAARILEWLRSESLITLQAREHLDVMRPAGRIKELRKQGFNILTYWSIESTGKAKQHVMCY